MRFDDRLATVLALPAANARMRMVKWRQLVDLLAQRRADDAGDRVAEAFAFLREHRPAIDVATRREIARSLAGRSIAPDLFAVFTEDEPSIAAPLVAEALMTPAQWIAALPAMSPTARALLRHRRDLAPEVSQALKSFGATDFVLTGTVGADVETPAGGEGGETQIRDLVARIEAFRKHREEAPGHRPGQAFVEAFQWETGADGVILWVGAGPRGPLVGQTIASIAEHGHHGVDGQAAGAFEKRAPFRDARFSVAGTGGVAGDWRISGVPFFDPATGSFIGYRGSARRPRIDEVARGVDAGTAPGLFGSRIPADSLRQLIHELRTPLNAIVGFAEMIDGQYMGPAGANYRARAGEIMMQANRLLLAVDDLDTAARIETSRFESQESTIDAVALLCRLHDAYERVAQQRGARIAIEIARELPHARVESGAAERMFARMLAATIGLAGANETIAASMVLDSHAGKPMLRLAIDRPRAIAGIAEAALLDPGYSPDGDWPGAPALGLGFALRLVRNLAEAVGGALIISQERFSLYLPPVEAIERISGQGQ